MNNDYIDVFKDYKLPFETAFFMDIDQHNEIHDEIELVWVIKGSVKVNANSKEYHLTNQTLFMINVNEPHSIVSDYKSVIIIYRFKNDYLHENNLFFNKMRFKSRVYTFKELAFKYKEVPLLISQLIRILISPDYNEILKYKVIGLYHMFVYELYTMLLKEKYLDVKSKNYDKYIERLNITLEYINNNFRHKISQEHLALTLNLSKYRLSHFIKDYIGISFQDYVTSVRLDKAMELLRTTILDVSTIAKSVGFSDVKYLNKALKDRINMTSLKYRKYVLSLNNATTIINKTDIELFKNELSTCLNILSKTL